MGLPKPSQPAPARLIRLIPRTDRRAGRYAGRLLLVSPFSDEREMYADYLRSQGYCVLETHSADTACRIAAEVLLSAVLTDEWLSDGEVGLGLTVRLKTNPRTRMVPVAILSGYPDAPNREHAVRVGCDRVLAKPCLPTAMAEALGEMIRAAR